MLCVQQGLCSSRPSLWWCPRPAPQALGGLSPLASSQHLGGGPAVGQMTTATAHWAGEARQGWLCGQGEEDGTGCVTDTALRGGRLRPRMSLLCGRGQL